MSNEKWYSITTLEQLIQALEEGLRVECVRFTGEQRHAVLREDKVYLLNNLDRRMNDTRIERTDNLTRWLVGGEYSQWIVLGSVNRIPLSELPV